MAHAIRYFCSWQSERYKHQMRLELWDKDYEGEATAMVLSGEPQLTMEEGDTICGSSLDFGLLSETNGQYLHLYTTDNHKYLIKILRDGAVMWEGYLLPEYYSEAYIAAPYTVNFTATDWLGMLKNVDFPAEDTRVPIIQIIKTCLQYTELPLDFACQLELRVEGINDTTNILGALYLNPITFTGYNCYEVLEKVLASFNATLRQMGHRWLISSIDDDVPLRLISWNSLSYTGNGESNNGEVIGTNFDGTFIDGSLAMVVSPAKKSVDLSQDIFYRESWLKDYDFRSADAWAWPDNTNIVKPGLAYYIQDGVLIEQISVEYLILRTKSTHELPYLSQVINVEGAPDDSEYTLGIKFFTPNLVDGDNITALWVKIINRSSTSLTQDVAYLSKDGWTNEDSYIELNGTSAEAKYISSHTYNRGGRQYLIYDKENWPTTKINFISIPYTGTLEIRIYPMYLAGFTSVINPSYYETYFGGVYLTKTNVTKNLTISSTLNPDAAETASSVNLMLCDSPEERNVELGVLNYFSLYDGALTTGKKWYYNGQEYEDFLHAMAYSYSRCYANKRQKLSGALYTDKIYNLCSFTDKWSSKRHIIKSWVYSIISERLDSMEIIETPAKEIELTLSTPEAGSSNKQNQPSGGTSGGGSTSMAGSGRYVNLDTAQEVSGEKTWNDNANFKKNINVAGDGIFGGEVVAIAGDGTPAGVTDYSALTGKPAINGVTLISGNNTLAALGIQAAGDYATISGVTALLANYATKTFVSNNYAGKSAFNAHTADTDIHITAAERVAWNAKWDYNEATIKAVKVTSASSADSVAWTGIKDKPTTIAGYGITDAYTKTETDNKLSGYLPLSGGTLTGTLVCDYNLSNQSFYTWRNSRQHSGEGGRSDTFIILQKADGTFNASFGTYGDSETDSYIYIGYKKFNDLNLRISPTSISWGDNSILHAGNYNSYVPTLTGTGASGTWGIDITGNAASATKLQDNTAFTAWGQTFFENGKPKNVSGDLKDVGNITASGKATIQGDIISGGEVAAIIGEGTPAGVTDYSALTGKPAINGVTLVSGNNTLAALGIQAAGDYATNSGVTTLLADYATKTFVSNNYAGKSAFNSHTADSDIHITAAERGAWNAKWDYNEATIKAVKVTSASSADSVAWSGISGKPTTFTPSAHTHTASEVSGLPTSLKNPYALTFGSKSYDGSAAATITASDLGALTSITKSMVEGVLTGNITSHTHSYLPLGGGILNRNSTIGFRAYSAYDGGGGWDVSVLNLYDSEISKRFGGLGYFGENLDLVYIYLGVENFNGNNLRIYGTGTNDIKWGDNNLIHSGNYNSYVPTLTGTGASGTWGINISGNATSATKLQTPCAIWGQSFDGNANVSGNIYLGNGGDYVIGTGFNNSNKTIYNKIVFGAGVTGLQYISGSWTGGYAIAHNFKVGIYDTTALAIMNSGNVLIGTTTDNGYKLQVNGSEMVYGDLIVDGEVSALVA